MYIYLVFSLCDVCKTNYWDKIMNNVIVLEQNTCIRSKMKQKIKMSNNNLVTEILCWISEIISAKKKLNEKWKI